MSTATATPPTTTAKIAEPTSKPVLRARSNRVGVSIFENQIERGDGNSFTAYDVKVTRSYKTADGGWEHTPTLRGDDLLDLAFAAQQAHSELLILKAKKS